MSVVLSCSSSLPHVRLFTCCEDLGSASTARARVLVVPAPIPSVAGFNCIVFFLEAPRRYHTSYRPYVMAAQDTHSLTYPQSVSAISVNNTQTSSPHVALALALAINRNPNPVSERPSIVSQKYQQHRDTRLASLASLASHRMPQDPRRTQLNPTFFPLIPWPKILFWSSVRPVWL